MQRAEKKVENNCVKVNLFYTKNDRVLDANCCKYIIYDVDTFNTFLVSNNDIIKTKNAPKWTLEVQSENEHTYRWNW